MTADPDIQDGFRIVGEKEPLTPIQRRLFNLMIWHALASGIDAPHHSIALVSLNDSLDTAGRPPEWLLLNLERIAATRIRWRGFPAGAALEESGFSPLLSACWVSEGALHYSLSGRVTRFLGDSRLRRVLALSSDDVFRHPFSAGIYRLLQNYADAGTTGRWRLDRFCEAAAIDVKIMTSSAAALRDKVVSPAMAEISLYSDLTVSAEWLRETDTGAPEIKFTVRRKDDARPDACLLLPGAGDGPLTPELAREQRFEAYKAGLVCDAAAAMSPAEMADIRRSFIDSIRKNAVMMKKYEKDGFDSLAVKLAFEVYQEKLLLSDRQRDPERFKAPPL
ncbi:MAG: hypothetical protein ABIL58_11855 [Pseudomonadota bacterium]